MRTVSVREMREQISKILEEAEKGETFVIKRCGREIAKLSPVDTDNGRLPSLGTMRSSIECKGNSLSQNIDGSRMQERF